MSFFEIYVSTLPIIATENLVMGTTLLLILAKNKTSNASYCLSILFLSTAMLMMALFNFVEIFLISRIKDYLTSFSVVVAVASLELFLLLYAYIASMNPGFITVRRIIIELLLIVVFTLPPLLIDTTTNSELFTILFYISIAFYILKYIASIIIYRNQYKKTQSELQEYYASGDENLLSWIHSTFHTVLAIGAVSIIVPLTNYLVLTCYQVFLFFAYFYIYFEVIKHEKTFNKLHEASFDQRTKNKLVEKERVPPPPHSFVILFDGWIQKRQYAENGITINDVAKQLNTNRTTLSMYLHTELNQNFYEWISKLRIEDGKKQLIENPALPISEIATYVGIEDRSNFDKLFKRLVGMSPASFRISQAKRQLL